MPSSLSSRRRPGPSAAMGPGLRACNPIPAKIEIRGSSLGVVPLLLYNSISGGRGIAMSQGARVIGPDRAQLRWEMVDLDSQLPDDHRARLVWAFVEGLDLREFYDRIKARDAVAGRPATDPQVVLAVWLYATLEGIGSARAIDRLCQQHAAYRWLCGGAPINHDLLATFRRENAAQLDRLLTQSVTGLIAEKLITLEEMAIDGTKVRACAGRGSMSKRKRLERIEEAVAERVAELKSELDKDPGEPERRRKKRALQAAEERARRVERARQKLTELAQEQPTVKPETERKRRWKHRREPAAVTAWRARMARAEGQEIHRRRKLTERAHGIIKNRGMFRFLVHGREKVRSVCVLQALALNLSWADTLRRRIAAAAVALPAIA